MVSTVHTYNKADRVLWIVFVLFLCALVLKHLYRDALLAKAFFASMEAALVGGIADWFAVTALFKKPLGFPWHTALIPKNRVKIIEATAHMVQYEFFSQAKLREHIKNVRLIDIFIGWMENQNSKQVCGRMASRCIAFILNDLDAKHVAAAGEQLFKHYAKQHKISPIVHALAKWVLANHKDEQFLDYILAYLTEIAVRNSTRQAIYDYLQQYKEEQQTKSLFGAISGWLGEKTNTINIDDATDAFQQELVSILNELSQPAHPLRVWVHQRLAQVADQISSNHVMNEAIEDWKEEVIDRINLQEALAEMVNTLITEARCISEQLTRLVNEPGFMRQQDNAPGYASYAPLLAWLVAAMDKYWSIFRQEQKMQDWVESYLQEAARHIIDSEHNITSIIVRDAMHILSDEELNRLIEAKAGEDLQWIRINGSIVGGVAGLAIFLIMQLAQVPILGLLFR